MPIHSFGATLMWRVARTVSIFAATALAGCSAPDTTGPSSSTPAKAFEIFWAQFDSTYSYFDYKAYDWNAARQSAEPDALASKDIESLIPILQRMVSPLKDGHIKFTNAGGISISSYVSPARRNWDQATWKVYADRAGWTQTANSLGYGRFGDIAYIAVGIWNPSLFGTAQLDGILDQIRDSKALILDVRPNEGGDDILALDFAARFMSSERVVQYTKSRNGPRHSDFGPLRERRVARRGAWQYTKPVYLLIGRASASSNETFILALKGLPNVTVLGDTTAGSSGNPKTFQLGGGWSFSVPQWIAYTPDMKVIEWNGIAPDVVVAIPPGTLDGAVDPVIDEAIRRASTPSLNSSQ
jgi:hypothetical protein